MTDGQAPSCSVTRLAWSDEALGEIALPKRPMRICAGFGSGLAIRRGDDPHLVWAIGDRGPNLKAKTAIKRYGVSGLDAIEQMGGAKLMPRLDLGPALAHLRVGEDGVETVRTFRIVDVNGAPVSGLPVPEGAHAECEPAFDLQGNALEPDPSGLDTEGIAALANGGFWIGDEFGPSLVLLDPDGKVMKRCIPSSVKLTGAAYPGRRLPSCHRRQEAAQPRLRGAGAVRRREVAIPRLPEPARPPG